MQSAILKAVAATDTITTGVEQTPDNQSVVILITGFVVVFLVLLLLIGIIKIYSGIVYAAQKKSESRKVSKTNAEPVVTVPALTEDIEQNDGLDLQTVAVITAAVEAFYSGKKVKVRNIRPASSERTSWAMAGLMDNIPSMRTEGLL